MFMWLKQSRSETLVDIVILWFNFVSEDENVWFILLSPLFLAHSDICGSTTVTYQLTPMNVLWWWSKGPRCSGTCDSPKRRGTERWDLGALIWPWPMKSVTERNDSVLFLWDDKFFSSHFISYPTIVTLLFQNNWKMKHEGKLGIESEVLEVMLQI